MIISWLKNRARRLLSTLGFSVQRLDALTILANKYGSDKGTMSYGHQYTRIYTHLFEPFREKEIVLLEMGLLRVDMDRRRGTNGAEGPTSATGAQAPSLEMWSRFFPRAHIYGFDIDDFTKVKLERCKILQGDMSSETDLSRLVKAISAPIDIIIDDASHASHHQQMAFGFLFPYLRPGGIYIIEDLYWQDPTVEKNDTPKTRDLLRQLQTTDAFRSPYLTEQQQSYIVDHTGTVQLFDSLGNVRDWPDSLGVITKR